MTRNAILEAAIRVMARDGLGGSSLAAVAREAGTSKTAVVYHFGSVEGLRTSIAQSLCDRLLDAVWAAAPDDAGRDELARRAIEVLLERDRRPLWAAGRELLLLGARSEDAAATIRAIHQRLALAVAGLLGDPPEPQLPLARAILAALKGHLDLWLCCGDVDPAPFRESALRVTQALLAASPDA